MAAETTRVKDIPTTATTAAADDYVLLDGATNGTRKGLASNLIPPAAAATAAAAVAGLVSIDLPSVIHAQVGDVFQLFYAEVVSGSGAIDCRCDIGISYSRYFEATPAAGNVGDHTLTIVIYKPDGVSVLATGSTVLRVSAAPANPASAKKVAILGDSLTQGGGFATELIRRVIGTAGTPAALTLSNFGFVGEGLAAATTGYGITGLGGWGWAEYLGTGRPTYGWVAESTHNKTAIDVGSVWSDGTHSFTLASVSHPLPFVEKIANGGMEEWGATPTDWTLQNSHSTGVLLDETSSAHSGAHSARLTRGAGDSAWYDLSLKKGAIVIVPGRKYRLRFWTRGSGGFYGVLATNGSAGWLVSGTLIKASESFTKVEKIFTVGGATGSTAADLYLSPATTVGGYQIFDDVSLADITETAVKLYGAGPLPASGTLTHVSGATNEEDIVFTTMLNEPPTPFWDSQDGEANVKLWGDRVSGGSGVTHFIVELGWNEWSRTTTSETMSLVLAAVASAYPTAKVFLLGLANPSPSGGLGANYGSASNLSSYVWARRFAREYDDLITAKSGGVVSYIPIFPVVDSKYAYPEADTAVNFRTSTTEKRGTNGVHPSGNGYLQMADAVYRQLCATL